MDYHVFSAQYRIAVTAMRRVLRPPLFECKRCVQCTLGLWGDPTALELRNGELDILGYR